MGKHLGYDFGSVKGQRQIVHVHMGLYGDFAEGQGKLPEPRGALRMRIWTRTDWLELRGPTDCNVWDETKWASLLARLGPDPLNKDKPGKMIERIGTRKTPIGALLMDQSIVSGVGNIYRAELLFRARVSPFRAGRDVPEPVLKAIWKDACALMPSGMVDRQNCDDEAEGPAAQDGRGAERGGALCISAAGAALFPLRHQGGDEGVWRA